jgi:hypothetical protein
MGKDGEHSEFNMDVSIRGSKINALMAQQMLTSLCVTEIGLTDEAVWRDGE